MVRYFIVNSSSGGLDGTVHIADRLEKDGVRQTGFGLVRRLGKPFPPAQETSQQMGGLSC